MRVGIARERRTGERRVAATPETVRQLAGLGLEVPSSPAPARHPGTGRRLRGGRRQGRRPARPRRPDVLLHVRPLDPETPARLRRGTITIGLCSPSTELRHRARAARRPRHGVRDGARAAHLPRAVDGRAHLPGARRRLPLRARGRDAAAAVLPAVHDGGRHDPAGEGARARRGRRRPPGHRHRQAPRRRASRRTTCARHAPTRSLDGRHVHPARPRAAERRGGYAKELGEDRAARQRELLAPHVAESDVLDHHRGDPRPPGAAARHRRHGARHAPGLGRRRPGGRDRRQRRGRGRRARMSRCRRRRRAAA